MPRALPNTRISFPDLITFRSDPSACTQELKWEPTTTNQRFHIALYRLATLSTRLQR